MKSTCGHKNTQTGVDDNGIEWTFCYDCNEIIAERTDEFLQAAKRRELIMASMSVAQRETWNLA